ncbi:hypothetical protein [Lysinibacillus antri]|uniref:Uncharacterized protein n=1 Tax=Lysinibacillus antri TaxID=2498145 RepID=A0A3S0R7V7_9BACI|nr:hypothetical protein [Lysinibacillus antri]RUL55606.1 hypothetical protein EK386_04580 [Lysinibacillus antri]
MTKQFEGLLITENRLIDAIEVFFKKRGFILNKKAKNNERGIDLELFKDGTTLYIEAKGSVKNKYDTDHNINAMPRTSVRDNVRKQINKLMEREEDGNYIDNAYYIAAWPETPIYREQVNKKAKALSRLGYLHLWVQKDLSVKIEGPDSEKEKLINLCSEQ